jgi:hypothetical protein
MSKTNSNNMNMCTINQVNTACDYIFNKRLFCIGSDDFRSRAFISSLEMPPLPLLMSNREEREALKKKQRSMIQKTIHEIKEAIKEEQAKPFLSPKGYELEESDEVNENALTEEEFTKWCEEPSES